jgi:ABC-type polysaccharide/polyol phosphate export permease
MSNQTDQPESAPRAAEWLAYGLETPEHRQGTLVGRFIKGIVSDVQQLIDSKYVLGFMVANKLKIKYRRSVLGQIWSLLNPMMMLGITVFCFGTILGRSLPRYATWVMTGFTPYNFFRECLSQGCVVLVRNETMIKKARVTGLIYPLTDTVVSIVNFGLSLLAMMVILLFLRVFVSEITAPHIQIVMIPVGVLLLMIFSFGLCLLTMVATTYFRDMEHILGVILRALYFGTPILYSIGYDAGPSGMTGGGGFVKSVTGPFAEVLRYNPLVYFFEFFRCGIYGGGWWPSPLTWMVTITCSAVSLVVGYCVFKRFEHEYVYRL